MKGESSTFFAPRSLEWTCSVNNRINLSATPNSSPLEEHGPPRPFMKLKENCSTTTSEVSTIADCRNSDSSDYSDCTLEEVEEEVRKKLAELRQLPYLDYVCHRCGKKNHLIQFCSVENPAKITPYQGSLVSEGWFSCESCRRSWHSLSSFSNMAQKCLKCGDRIFPHRMKPIKKQGDGVDYRFNLCNLQTNTTSHL